MPILQIILCIGKALGKNATEFCVAFMNA